MSCVVEVAELRKRYGATVALDGVTLTVDEGEIFGVVGPNGAGKTTLVECMAGLRRQDGGTVRVLGLDPGRQGDELRQRIGIQLQQAALPDQIKVEEALDLYASFYRRPAPWRPLLAQWGLTEKRRAAFATLSGGQKQRLFIALALVNDPALVFLDELTSGLDPEARRATWDLIRAIRDRGTTVVLVSHDMAEVEHLCDRVALVDRGRIVALDAPRALVRRLPGAHRVRFGVANGFDPAPLRAIRSVSDVVRTGNDVVVYASEPVLAPVAVALADHGLHPPDLRAEQATLEDVFLALTSRREARGARREGKVP